MKTPVVILCGGRGTRLGHQSVPKGLIEIGGRPILWHIMKLYAAQGFDDFILCLGFGGDTIKEAFSKGGTWGSPEPHWNVRFAETGLDTPTGGRLKKIEGHIEGTFMATYGDGVADIDLTALLEHHLRQGKIATITCARANIPFGLVHLGENDEVTGFSEKPRLDQRINGGFFVFEPQVMDYLDEESVLEAAPFERLAKDGQMSGFPLDAFWACMDTYKEAQILNDLWETKAPWKRWQD